MLASGSLDHTVSLWDAAPVSHAHDSAMGQELSASIEAEHRPASLNLHNFGKPIASAAFSSCGDILAVASGHKVCGACSCAACVRECLIVC
jgi:WD40 repeat protein